VKNAKGERDERHNPPCVTVNKRKYERCTVKLRREIEEHTDNRGEKMHDELSWLANGVRGIAS